MPGARSRFALTTLVLACLLAACASIAPSGESPSPAASVAGATVLPTSAPSTAPSEGATTAPTVAPSHPPKTPKPQKSAETTQPSGTPLANLIVTKFVSSADPIIAGDKTEARVTIKNTGTADAGTFGLGISWAENNGLGGGADSPMPVDGLAAGDSVQVTVDISQSVAGDWTYTAQADSDEAITESDEDDNTATLAVTSVSLPNIAWVLHGFSIVPDPQNDGNYEFDEQFINKGTADVMDSFKVGLTWTSGDQSGSLDPVDCCTTEGGPVIAAGQTTGVEGFQGIAFPGPGDYHVTALIDPDNNIVESNENDNSAEYEINVP